ncbi:MAG: FadR family transcriptional regulator [Rhodobiaceae bacterium]|nr:FadR family transcriptional regulator [Rhodobiaceae bacterium]MCC0054613.1 FadR family transcriptional regulator [Rhodobiaceae bacterium]
MGEIARKTGAFIPVKTRRAFEEICDQIRGEIQAGNLVPGDRLPSERDLAEQFQVSRSTVREAFRTLEISGVVTLHKGSKGGAVLQRGDNQPITQTMHDLLMLGSISLQDFTEARVCIQKEIIELACERATDEDYDAIEQNIARTSEISLADRLEERTELTIEFYSLLARASKNSAMAILMSAITEPLRDYLRRLGPDRSWNVAESRLKFLGHLRRRDKDAAVAEMVAHMTRLHAFMIGKIES